MKSKKLALIKILYINMGYHIIKSLLIKWRHKLKQFKIIINK